MNVYQVDYLARPNVPRTEQVEADSYKMPSRSRNGLSVFYIADSHGTHVPVFSVTNTVRVRMVSCSAPSLTPTASTISQLNVVIQTTDPNAHL